MDLQALIATLEHPLALGSLRSWLRLLRSGTGVEPPFRGRAAVVTATTALTAPLRRLEDLRWGARLAQVAIHPEPVVILGHWRTGTTHLQNLLYRDPQFGAVSTFQCMAPGFCLVGEKRLKPALAGLLRRLHPTRLIDQIPLDLDAPMEEDFAIAGLSPYAFLHLFSFPCQADEYFERYALLRGLSAETLSEWRQVYLGMLRKATFRAGGKRLLLKSPANTGRVPALLGLFPQARFIHITRDPYHVFQSMRVVYRTVLPRSQLQAISPGQADACILRFYSLLMRQYLADRGRIPPGRLVELRYEDLEARPLAELERVYQELDLPGWQAAAPAVQAYLETLRGYRKNAYRVDAEVIAQVNRHWGFALEAWEYPRR